MWKAGIVIFYLIVCLMTGNIKAEDTQMETYMEELDLEELQENVKELLPEDGIDVRQMLLQLCNGELPISAETIWNVTENTLFSEMKRQRTRIVQILILAVAASVFSDFMGAFTKSKVQEIAFYMVYLLLFVLLLESFRELYEVSRQTMAQILQFMRLLLPVYLLAASLAARQLTAIGFYEGTLFFITVVQSLIQYVLMPAVSGYVLIAMLNNVTREEHLSKMTDLIQNGVNWLLKSLLALVIGVQTIQNMLFPALDHMKNSIWIRAGGAVPVIGNTLSSVTETILSAASVLKSAVGVGGMIILIYVCIRPVLRLALCLFLYKLVSAVLQPVAEPRFVEGIDKMADGVALLLLSVAVTGVMFFLVIAIVTTTGGGI